MWSSRSKFLDTAPPIVNQQMNDISKTKLSHGGSIITFLSANIKPGHQVNCTHLATGGRGSPFIAAMDG
jgi:hypothetical protein